MEWVTTAYETVAPFSGHWFWIIPLATMLIALSLDVILRADGEVFWWGLLPAIIVTLLTLVVYAGGTSYFDEQRAVHDLKEIGIEDATFIDKGHGEEFTGSRDGQHIKCAVLETTEEYTFDVLCND